MHASTLFIKNISRYTGLRFLTDFINFYDLLNSITHLEI